MLLLFILAVLCSCQVITPIGNATLVTPVSFQHLDPVVVSLEGGRFLIAYDSVGQHGNFSAVYGRLFSTIDGNSLNLVAVGDEFLLSNDSESIAYEPTLTHVGNNRVLVRWIDFTGATYPSNVVYGRILDCSGDDTPVYEGPATVLQQKDYYDPYVPFLQSSINGNGAYMGNDRTVIVEDFVTCCPTFRLVVIVVDTSGNSPIVINETEITPTAYAQSELLPEGAGTLYPLSDQRFILTWADISNTTHGQLFELVGNAPSAVGTPFQVNTNSANVVAESTVVPLEDDLVAIVMTSFSSPLELNATSKCFSVEGSVFDASGDDTPVAVSSSDLINIGDEENCQRNGGSAAFYQGPVVFVTWTDSSDPYVTDARVMGNLFNVDSSGFTSLNDEPFVLGLTEGSSAFPVVSTFCNYALVVYINDDTGGESSTIVANLYLVDSSIVDVRAGCVNITSIGDGGDGGRGSSSSASTLEWIL